MQPILVQSTLKVRLPRAHGLGTRNDADVDVLLTQHVLCSIESCWFPRWNILSCRLGSRTMPSADVSHVASTTMMTVLESLFISRQKWRKIPTFTWRESNDNQRSCWCRHKPFVCSGRQIFFLIYTRSVGSCAFQLSKKNGIGADRPALCLLFADHRHFARD